MPPADDSEIPQRITNSFLYVGRQRFHLGSPRIATIGARDRLDGQTLHDEPGAVVMALGTRGSVMDDSCLAQPQLLRLRETAGQTRWSAKFKKSVEGGRSLLQTNRTRKRTL
jgi:hypothetical protein